MFKQTDFYILIPAFGSFLFSVALWFGFLGVPNKDAGLFVAVWVPSILSLGCFAKLSFRGKSNG